MSDRMPFPTCVPELTDGVVRLRAHREGDAARIAEQCNDPESVRWTTAPTPYDEAMGREWVGTIAADWEREGGSRLWAIEAVADDGTEHAHRFLGTIDLRPEGAGIASLGFGLHPEGRGRHLMAGAVRLVTRWWFDQGGVRMYWKANRGNLASWRVAWACGFTFHATLPEHLDHHGAATDAWVASVGREDDLTTPVHPWREAAVLKGARVRLRPWRDEDVAAVEVRDSPPHFMPEQAQPTVEGFADWLLLRRERMSRGGSTHWCIADADSDRALGDLLLIHTTDGTPSAELGYFLFTSARGRGLVVDAARLVLAHALAPEAEGGLGLRSVDALTVGDNEASARVLQRLGFREWGREPAFCERADGSLDDARHWVLVPD